MIPVKHHHQSVQLSVSTALQIVIISRGPIYYIQMVGDDHIYQIFMNTLHAVNHLVLYINCTNSS